jgi:hypothetical protein
VWRRSAGLVLENCRRMNVTGCTILDCDGAGLLLKDVVQSRVSDCLIRDDRPHGESVALQVVGGSENQLLDNLLQDGKR